MCYMIYFDNAATSFYKPKEVMEEINNSLNKLTANPGRSGHFLSIKAMLKVYETRENIKRFFNAKSHNVIFTKNCSEALNIAIFGLLKKGDHVIATCYEHNSVLRPLESLKEKGVEVSILNCDLKDFYKEFESEIKPNTKLVITTMISNVTGELCDVFSVGKICKQHSILYLIDAAQACGHVDINFEKLNVDILTFAGHKGLLGITGVGGLLIKENINLNHFMYGGTGTNSIDLNQPKEIPEGFEVGTIPTISIFSLNGGINFLTKNFEKIIKKEEKLSKYLYFSLKKLKFLEIYSKIDSVNVFSFNIKNMDSMQVANILNEKYGICVRSGLHCAPLIHKKLKTEEQGAVRVSLDFNNSYKEIDCLIYALKDIVSF